MLRLRIAFASKSFVRTISTDSYSSSIPYFTASDMMSGLKQFSEIIDVRTPAEYSEDRVLPSVNLPVLHNDQRIEVKRLLEQPVLTD